MKGDKAFTANKLHKLEGLYIPSKGLLSLELAESPLIPNLLAYRISLSLAIVRLCVVWKLQVSASA